MAEDTSTVVTWTGVWVSLLGSILHGLIFYLFFLYQRAKDKDAYAAKREQNDNDSEASTHAFALYEPRQYTRRHRSPPAFGSNWWQDAYNMNDEETLRCIGLDSFMFLRLLRLGARICGLGSALSIILIPIYATGGARGNDTEKFNRITLARVEQGSSWRLYMTVFVWWFFVAAILVEVWKEWALYYKNRTEFLAQGDIDMPQAYRYTVRVEQVSNNSDTAMRGYFDRLFPEKVKHTASCLETTALEKLIDERKKNILKLEAATAAMHAKPNKPRPQVRVKRVKVDAVDHFEAEIARLNKEIDAKRSEVCKAAGLQLSSSSQPSGAGTTTGAHSNNGNKQPFEGDALLSKHRSQDAEDPTHCGDEMDVMEERKNMTSTAFVTFTSLRSKQAAVQCELTGNPDSVVVFPAADPNGILWENAGVPLSRQNTMQLFAAMFWMAGILFWAFPVSIVTSIANLNSILQAVGLQSANPASFWYGLVAGLLPVLALSLLMMALYKAITAGATRFIRYKSWPEVDSYCLHWYMLFQFANLWLILIGGSLFNQIDVIVKNPANLVNIIAKALPGASVFFVNMIIVSSFGSFGMELSMLPTYGTKLIMNLIRPEAARTQRELDDAKKPPSMVWGQSVPPVIFIFLVIFIYMPIVPIVEIFGLVYFNGMYLVSKHQFLHVYVQEFEGGGDVTWRNTFGFVMACLYTGEVVFIAYMGLKTAPIQSGLGFVPLIVTILTHFFLNRKLIKPIHNLSLEVAADVELADGELSDVHDEDKNFYRQPALDPDQDERGPMPYRRKANEPPVYNKMASV